MGWVRDRGFGEILGRSLPPTSVETAPPQGAAGRLPSQKPSSQVMAKSTCFRGQSVRLMAYATLAQAGS